MVGRGLEIDGQTGGQVRWIETWCVCIVNALFAGATTRRVAGLCCVCVCACIFQRSLLEEKR
jgi:hypothetical protein